MRMLAKLALVVVALGAAAFAVIRWRSGQPGSAISPTAPVPVVTAMVQQHDEPIVLSGLGTVQALNMASIQSQVTGVLEQVNFTEGQVVKKGDVLAKIDPRLYQAALAQAQGQLAKDTALHAQAESDLARYQKLGTENSIALQQVADQQFLVAQYAAAMETDKGVIASDQTQLDYTTLRAPFDGVTGLLQIDIGNLIQPSNTTGIVVLTQVQPISVVFTLPNNDIAAVQSAMARGPVQTTVYDQTGKKELDVGTLLSINNQASPTSGTFQLKAIFPNQHRQLWPGTFVNVRPHDLGRPQRADGAGERAAAERQRAVRLCRRRRQKGVGAAGRGCTAPACGRAGFERAASGRDRGRPGPVSADAGNPRRRDGGVRRAEPVNGQRRNAAVNLSSGFITRPIATALMMVAVVALGIVSYVLLPVAALPNIDTPTIQVTAQMPGADPQTMASSVATQLERQFGQIPGLRQMTSSSGTGFTEITLQFDRSRTVDFGRTRRAGGDQRHAGAIAGHAPEPADLSQDQSGGHADPADIADLRRSADHDGQRLCLLDSGAEAFASPWRRPRNGRRQPKSVDPNPAQSGPARRHEP